MKKNLYLLAVLSAMSTTSTFADQIPNTFLINNQLHQTSNGGLNNHVNIGYYFFSQTSSDGGAVSHYRLEMAPHDGYNNTFISAKHINVPIRDKADSEQICGNDDMGRMTRPTVDYQVSNGTYTYINGVLTITIDGVSIEWSSSDNDRFEIARPKFQASTGSTQTSQGTFEKAMGFGYFTDSMGPQGALDFKQHFKQGDDWNSASGYAGGKLYSNTIQGQAASDASAWPEYIGEHKMKGYFFSNQGVDGVTHGNTYSAIIEESDASQAQHGEDIKQHYQWTVTTNYYTAWPTLIYENHGHIKPRNEVQYWTNNGVNYDSWYSRKCWTKLDTSQTQGHNNIHFGVWDSSRNMIGKLLSVEVAKNNAGDGTFYPVIVIGYTKG